MQSDSTNIDKKPLRKFIGFLLLLLNSVAIFFQKTYEPNIVFEWHILNLVKDLALYLTLSLILFWFAFVVFDGLFRWITCLIATLIFALFLFFVALTYFDGNLALDGPPVFEVLSTLEVGDTKYELIQSSGGATVSDAVSLRKVQKILNGVKRVTRIKKFDSAERASFIPLPSGNVLVMVAPYGNNPTKVFEFKP